MNLKLLPDLEAYCNKKEILSYSELFDFLQICSYYADYLTDYIDLSCNLYNIIIRECDAKTPFVLTSQNKSHFKKLQADLTRIFEKFQGGTLVVP